MNNEIIIGLSNELKEELYRIIKKYSNQQCVCIDTCLDERVLNRESYYRHREKAYEVETVIEKAFDYFQNSYSKEELWKGMWSLYIQHDKDSWNLIERAAALL